MTVDELIARFPQIPAHLRDEPALAAFSRAFGDPLKAAQKPSACSTDHTPGNRTYLKLLGPIDIHGFGLYTRERVIEELTKLVAGYEDDPEGFLSEMLGGEA